ncbi:MAG: bis(5'-nucleosyl)-tetraphosphatase (symmetrical) YqeK [Solobacterium sp.]|nr:bis(5'-nucleosyl)-tetraphosphatase (symmetrical) YqeK [Solobacterium sp.]
MNRTGILYGSYDPLTQKELEYARKIRRERHLDLLILVPSEKGVLARSERMHLLKRALMPYRRIACGNAVSGAVFEEDMPAVDEEEVRSGIFRLAACGIRKMLVEEGYYLEEMLDANCKKKRAAHSRAVADLCRELAQASGVDEELAWRAGMLHDITKNRSEEWGRKVLEVHDPELLDMSPKVWHASTAAVWLKQETGITDRRMLEAIRNHTLGTGRSRLDRILYIADKCERTRGYDSEKEIALAKKSLAEGAALVYAESEAYRLNKGGKP